MRRKTGETAVQENKMLEMFDTSPLTGRFWLAILIGVPLSVAIGLALEVLLIKRLYDRDHLYQVLLTYGLILMIEETRSILFGDDDGYRIA